MQSPSGRRLFQFGLKGLLVALTVIAVAIKLADDYRLSSEIDGTWLGTGRHSGMTMRFGRRVCPFLLENR